MKRFFAWLDRTFIKPVEESRMSLGTFVLIAAGYIAIRNLLEGGFESLHLLGLSTITLSGIEELFLHLNLSWLFVFMSVIVLLRFTTGHDIRKIARVLLIYSFIVIIPTIIDPLIRPGGYYLLYPTDVGTVISAVKSAFQPWLVFGGWEGSNIAYGSSPGMLIEGYLGVILVAVYSGLRAPTRVRKIISVLLSPVVIVGALTISGGAQAFVGALMPLDPATGATVYFSGGLISSSTRKYALVLLFPFILVLWLGLWLYNRDKAGRLLRSLDPFMLAITGVAAGSGFLFAWLGLRDVLAGVPRNPFDYLAVVGLLVLGVLTASIKTFAGRAADWSNTRADRRLYRRGALGTLLMAVAFCWSLGYSPLFIWVAGMAVMLVIELPPLRLKRFLIPSSLLHGLMMLAMVLIGYSLFTTNRTLSVFPWQLAVAVFAVAAVVFLGRDLLLRYRSKPSQTEGKS